MASALISSSESDQSMPWVLPQSTPAAVADTAASPQATAIARSTLMPTALLNYGKKTTIFLTVVSLRLWAASSEPLPTR